MRNDFKAVTMFLIGLGLQLIGQLYGLNTSTGKFIIISTFPFLVYGLYLLLRGVRKNKS